VPPFAADLRQRLGRLDPQVAQLAGRAPIWLHAASVGEVLSAQPLVECLRRDEPEHPLFATTTTLTGRAAAQQRLGLPATLLPLDLPPVVGGALRRLAPAALVILETEIWPSLIRGAARDGVPVLLVSARLSPRAAVHYTRFRPLFRAVLARVTAVAAQTEADAERFVALGAARERVSVLGSLKFARRASEIEARPRPVDLGARRVVVAASTQPGEEAAVLDACRILWIRHPEVLLVLAPRRPERFAEVAQLVERAGLRLARRSGGEAAVPAEAQVFLLDSVGELASFFSGAAASFVGGTLAPLGGHNVLEPVAFGVPVAFGPHLDSVRQAADLLLVTGAGARVTDGAELGRVWSDILDDPASARLRVEGGRQELERRGRVAEEVAALVRRHLRRTG
jgi:3-deoxy-D-manno-octulosonic-acid transferase